MPQVQFDTPCPVPAVDRLRVEGGLAGALAAADDFRRHLLEAQSRAAGPPPSAPPVAPSPSSAPSPPEAPAAAASPHAADDLADEAPATSAEEPMDRHEDRDGDDDDRPAETAASAPSDALRSATPDVEPSAEVAEEVAEAVEGSAAKADADAAAEARSEARAAREVPGTNGADAGQQTRSKETEGQSTSESPPLRARDESPRDLHRGIVTTSRDEATVGDQSAAESAPGDPSFAMEHSTGAKGEPSAAGTRETGARQLRDSAGESLATVAQGAVPSAAARTTAASASTGRPSRKTGDRPEPAQGKPSDGPRGDGEPIAAPSQVSATVAVSSSDGLDGRATADGVRPTTDAGAPPVPSASAVAEGSPGPRQTMPGPAASAARPVRGVADDSRGGVDRARFVQRVSRAFQSLGDRAGVVRLRLSPPELGSLRLEVAVRDGAMTARLEVETHSARQMLLDSLPALRERLAQQDIRIERFSVDLAARDGGGLPNSPGHHGSAQDRAPSVPIGAPLRSGAARTADPVVPPPAAPDHGHQLNVIV